MSLFGPPTKLHLSGFTFVLLPRTFFHCHLFAVRRSNLQSWIWPNWVSCQFQGPFYPCSFSIIRDWKLFCFFWIVYPFSIPVSKNWTSLEDMLFSFHILVIHAFNLVFTFFHYCTCEILRFSELNFSRIFIWETVAPPHTVLLPTVSFTCGQCHPKILNGKLPK